LIYPDDDLRYSSGDSVISVVHSRGSAVPGDRRVDDQARSGVCCDRQRAATSTATDGGGGGDRYRR